MGKNRKNKENDEEVKLHPNIVSESECKVAPAQDEKIRHSRSEHLASAGVRILLGITLAIGGFVLALQPKTDALKVCTKDQEAVDYLFNTDYATTTEYDNLYNEEYTATTLSDDDTYVVYQLETGESQGSNIVLQTDQELFDELQPGDIVYYNYSTQEISYNRIPPVYTAKLFLGALLAFLGAAALGHGVADIYRREEDFSYTMPLSSKFLAAYHKEFAGAFLGIIGAVSVITGGVFSTLAYTSYSAPKTYDYDIGYIYDVYQETEDDLVAYATDMTVEEGVPFSNFRYSFDQDGNMTPELFYYGDFVSSSKTGSIVTSTEVKADRISIDEATYNAMREAMHKDNSVFSALSDSSAPAFTLHSDSPNKCSVNNKYSIEAVETPNVQRFNLGKLILLLGVGGSLFSLGCGLFAIKVQASKGLYTAWCELGKECELPIEIVNAAYKQVMDDGFYYFELDENAFYAPPVPEPETDIALEEGVPELKKKKNQKEDPSELAHAYDPDMLLKLSSEEQERILRITEQDSLQTVIFKIRGLNDLIPDDQQLSTLLYSLEDTVNKINTNPDIKPDNADVSRARRVAFPEISGMLLKYVAMCQHYQGVAPNRAQIIERLDQEIAKVITIVDKSLINAEQTTMEYESRSTMASAIALQQLYGDGTPK